MLKLNIPTEQVMFDQHISNTIFQRLIVSFFFHWKFPIRVQIERQLRQNSQITFYLHPPGTVHERPWMVPGNNNL
jgi:hypothetical protein